MDELYDHDRNLYVLHLAELNYRQYVCILTSENRFPLMTDDIRSTS